MSTKETDCETDCVCKFCLMTNPVGTVKCPGCSKQLVKNGGETKLPYGDNCPCVNDAAIARALSVGNTEAKCEDDMWSCPHCTTRNTETAKVCVVCSKSRGTVVTTWSCSHCTFVNGENNTKCAACNR